MDIKLIIADKHFLLTLASDLPIKILINYFCLFSKYVIRKMRNKCLQVVWDSGCILDFSSKETYKTSKVHKSTVCP